MSSHRHGNFGYAMMPKENPLLEGMKTSIRNGSFYIQTVETFSLFLKCRNAENDPLWAN